MSMRFIAASLSLILSFIPVLHAVLPVNSAPSLEQAIRDANVGIAPLIQFTSSFVYAQTFRPLNADGVLNSLPQTFTIDGQGETLTQTGVNFRGFFARSNPGNSITIQNLTINGAYAKGGDSIKGGGGLGAGGGLFLNTGSTVILDNVSFQNCRATGGNSQSVTTNDSRGGGGLGGNGGGGGLSIGTGGGGFSGNGGDSGGLGGTGGGGFNGNGGNVIGGSYGGSGGGGGGYNGGNTAGSGAYSGGGGGAGDGSDGNNNINFIGGNGGNGSLFGDGGGGGGGGSGSVDTTSGNIGTFGPAGMGGSIPGGGGGGGTNNTAQTGSGGHGGNGGSGFGGGGGAAGLPPPKTGGNGGNGGFGGGGGGAGNGLHGGNGGNGGFGGGGGAAGRNSPSTGGNGGFGGGGGGATSGVGGSGGAGGFGGGGGGIFGAGGFGGGNAGPIQGGGGAAFGGAIFIQNGAELRIRKGISFLGNQITPGTGNTNGLARGRNIFMMSSGQIIVENLTTDSSVPFPIESDFDATYGIATGGGLTLDAGNTAIFTLNGANTYTGTTNINSGSLYVEGSVITPVIVNGGVFGGNATLAVDGSVSNSGDLTINSGMVAPGGDNFYGTINVGRNLLFIGAGSFFDAEIDSVGNTDFIAVTGTATLTGTIDIQAVVGNFLAGQTITILDAAGGISGTFSNKIIPLHPNGGPLFKVLYNANSVDLLVLEDLVFNAASTGQNIHSGNPQHVVDYILSQLPIDPNSDFGFIVNSLGLVSNDKINQVLNMMHPGSFGLLEFMNLTTNAQIMEIFSQHLFGRPSASSPTQTISQLEPSLTATTGDRPFYSSTPVRRGCGRDENKHHNVWAQPFGTWNSQSQKGELRGANFDSAGILTGYDYLFKNFYVGAGLGYAYTNFRWDGSAGKGHIDQVYGDLYGSYFRDYFAATLSTMVGGNFYDTDRYIRYNAPFHPGSNVDRSAHSHYSGIQWTNHLGLIGDFSPLSVPLQIFANLNHFYLHNESFSESGAKSINLKVNSKTSNALRSELGLSSSYTFNVSGGCWTPYVRVSWVNKTLLSSSSYRGGFRGQVGTFSVSATSKGTNQFAPGIGISFANTHGFSILLNSRAELNAKMKNYSADLHMDYAF